MCPARRPSPYPHLRPTRMASLALSARLARHRPSDTARYSASPAAPTRETPAARRTLHLPQTDETPRAQKRVRKTRTPPTPPARPTNRTCTPRKTQCVARARPRDVVRLPQNAAERARPPRPRRTRSHPLSKRGKGARARGEDVSLR
ncbi:hypothetical protein B5F41_01585 [Gordonibacter sp. An232A]|nr:hypothetical protein B5F41_01585 [Gordonibacter sp. An232A]